MNHQETSRLSQLPILAITPCQREKPFLVPRDECPDLFFQTVLSLIRFIGAAYTTGSSDCWEAAHRLCDDAIDVVDGPLLVARVAALVRILRCNCQRDLVYMPPCCKRLSADEAQLICLLKASHGGVSDQLTMALAGLVDPSHEAMAVQAINALIALSPGQIPQMNRAQTGAQP